MTSKPTDMEEQVAYVEENGSAVMPDGMNEHYTLCGIRVAEPKENWGQDYWDNADAEYAGCIILKPSVFGISGMSTKEVKQQFGV